MLDVCSNLLPRPPLLSLFRDIPGSWRCILLNHSRVAHSNFPEVVCYDAFKIEANKFRSAILARSRAYQLLFIDQESTRTTTALEYREVVLNSTLASLRMLSSAQKLSVFF